MIEHSRLDQVLAPGGIRVLFQPIFEVVSASLRMHALECLSRGPRGTTMERADVLFDYVRLKREESIVDRLCVDASLREVSLLEHALRINVNVHASTLGRDPDFVNFLRWTARAHSVDLARVVVEIVEHSPVWDGRSFQKALEELRAEGVALALDDVGMGQSNYRMILDCRPDYFKIDRYLITGIHSDRSRQVVLDSVLRLARDLGTRVIAEGVEHGPDFTTIRDMGVTLVQGFLFAPPRERSSFTTEDLAGLHRIADEAPRTEAAEALN